MSATPRSRKGGTAKGIVGPHRGNISLPSARVRGLALRADTISLFYLYVFASLRSTQLRTEDARPLKRTLRTVNEITPARADQYHPASCAPPATCSRPHSSSCSHSQPPAR